MLEKSLLWRLNPPTDTPPSYLFGAMHVRDLRAFSRLATAQACMLQCELVATEFDFKEIDPDAMAETLRLPEGQSLDKLLTPGVWKNLDKYARRSLGISAEALRFQHPMPLSAMLIEAELNSEAPLSLDETIWRFGVENGKETMGLETFQEQLAVIQDISLDDHLANLVWTLKNFGRQRRRLMRMLEWYMEGDINQLYQAAKRDARGLRHILLFDRNKRMAERLIETAQKQSVFCAVGAGHLAGQFGMLRLMKKAGFAPSAVFDVC